MQSSYRQSFELLWAYIKPEWKRVLGLLFFLLTGIALQLLQPQILRDFIDLAIGETSETALGGLTSLTSAAILFLVVAIFNQILRAGATYITEDVRWRTTNALRADLAQHGMRLDMGYHNSRTPGELISRIDEDVNVLSNFFSQFILQIFGNGLLILGVIFILFREEWRIGLGFAVFVVLTWLVLRWVIQLAIPHFRAFFAMGAALFAFIEERLAGTEDIRANGGVAFSMLQLHQTLRKQYVIEQKAYALGMLTFTTTQGFFNIGTALGLGLGGYLFQQDIVTIGTVYLITNYSAMLREPLHRLTQQLQDFQRAVAAVARVRELYFTETQLDANEDSAERLSEGALAIEFDDISFQYVKNTPVLRHLTFDLEPGKVMGLLGRTGSGKTTTTRLLFRLYEVNEGVIRIGRKPIQDLPLSHLREKIGIVTQDVQLFNATIRDNLTFFDASVSDGRIMQAIGNLGLTDWFASLPNGLETQLEAGARGLSAGEAQLLAFTRVFLKNPGLVILDEASSRLDPATEAMIERAVDKLLTNRTAIIVAHRLATVQRADDILILEDGAIKEYGDRIELAANGDSHFAQLLKTGLEEVLV